MNKCGNGKIQGKHKGNSLFFDILSKGLFLVFLFGLSGQFIFEARAEGLLGEKMDKLNVEADYRFDEIKKINILLDAARFNAQDSAINYLGAYSEIKKAAENFASEIFANAVFSDFIESPRRSREKFSEFFNYVAEKNRELNDSFSSFSAFARKTAADTFTASLSDALTQILGGLKSGSPTSEYSEAGLPHSIIPAAPKVDGYDSADAVEKISQIGESGIDYLTQDFLKPRSAVAIVPPVSAPLVSPEFKNRAEELDRAFRRSNAGI